MALETQGDAYRKVDGRVVRLATAIVSWWERVMRQLCSIAGYCPPISDAMRRVLAVGRRQKSGVRFDRRDTRLNRCRCLRRRCNCEESVHPAPAMSMWATSG
jgi:hypothetical protein